MLVLLPGPAHCDSPTSLLISGNLLQTVAKGCCAFSIECGSQDLIAFQSNQAMVDLGAISLSRNVSLTRRPHLHMWSKAVWHLKSQKKNSSDCIPGQGRSDLMFHLSECPVSQLIIVERRFEPSPSPHLK